MAAPRSMRGQAKPCKCGADHLVVQREDEPAGAFAKREFASRSCCSKWGNAQRKPRPVPATAEKWLQHPWLLRLSDEKRDALLPLLARPISDEAVERKTGVDAEAVRVIRRARRLEQRGLSRRQNNRERAAEAAAPQPEPMEAPKQPDGSMDLFLYHLRRHRPYGHGEPTRETVHGWASSHSGKRELSTAQVAALRAPTVVCTVSMLDALA